MKSPSNSGVPDATPVKNNKVKNYLIGALILAALGGMLYFVGLTSGKAQMAAQEAKFGVERNGLQSKVTEAEAARDAALDRSAMMETRSALYRTAIDLDARNFGTANDKLKEAATALATVKGTDTAALQREISATDLNVAVDLGDQREKVLGFADQLNTMMPAPIESSNMPPASSPEDTNSESAPSIP